VFVLSKVYQKRTLNLVGTTMTNVIVTKTDDITAVEEDTRDDAIEKMKIGQVGA